MNPSGPCRTSRTRCFNSVTIVSRRNSHILSLNTTRSRPPVPGIRPR